MGERPSRRTLARTVPSGSKPYLGWRIRAISEGGPPAAGPRTLERFPATCRAASSVVRHELVRQMALLAGRKCLRALTRMRRPRRLLGRSMSLFSILVIVGTLAVAVCSAALYFVTLS